MDKKEFSQTFHNMMNIEKMINCTQNLLQVQPKFEFTT